MAAAARVLRRRSTTLGDVGALTPADTELDERGPECLAPTTIALLLATASSVLSHPSSWRRLSGRGTLKVEEVRRQGAERKA